MIARSQPYRPLRWKQGPLLSGAVMAACFVAIASLPVLRGLPLKRFLMFFFVACAAYAFAVVRLTRTPPSQRMIWAFALLFRVAMLFATPPALSDDVYRYMWDGRLANAGVSPYAHSIDSRLLDRFDSPQRALVNNAWMASPYLPVAQALFATVYRLAPDNAFAFQVAAIVLDLLTGWMITDVLRRLSLPTARVLIYLWNPLVVVEFAHGAHIDALMLFLTMAALRALISAPRSQTVHRRGANSSLLGDGFESPFALAAATLTKGIPALLLPVVVWRWGWRRTLLYAGLLILILLPFGLGAGWGVAGPQDGEGVFGALRIYGARWNYNGGLYHWLEVALSGYRTPGAVPSEIVGEASIRTAKLIMVGALGLVLVVVALKSRRCQDDVEFVRLATVPLAAYLLLTTTVHPWYVTAIIPFLPFFQPQNKATTRWERCLGPWLYFTAAVALSYLTYVDPANLREYDWVRLAEYVPLYVLLIWCVFSDTRFPTGLGKCEK